jgi:hypothetical protein
VSVAVVHAAAWSVESARDGAAELAIAIRVARLQRVHSAVGLICVGDRHGMLERGGERALRRAVVNGVLVVRLARSGEVASTPDDLFLDGGNLDAAIVEPLLTALLQRHGPPPVAADPDHVTPRELTAIRAHLAPFRRALLIERGAQFAANQ